MLRVIHDRCASFGLPVIIATPDPELAYHVPNVRLSRHEDNVAQRLHDLTDGYDAFIRVCGDNPFIMPHLFRDLIGPWPYACHTTDGTPAIKEPHGIFAEFVNREALGAKLRTMSKYEAEHVTPALYPDAHLIPIEIPFLRLAVDTPHDFTRVSALYHLAYEQGKQYDIQWLSNS